MGTRINRLGKSLGTLSRAVVEAWKHGLRFRDPAFWAENNKRRNAAFARESAKAGHGVEKLTANHSDPILAAIGKAFDEMLERPLSKKFLKKRPNLYVTETMMPGAVTPEVIQIPESLVKIATVTEVKAVVAHELGHLIRGDLTPAVIAEGVTERFPNQQKERMADELAVVLSGEPQALKTALKKAQDNLTQAIPRGDNISARLMRWVDNRNRTIGTRKYPSLVSRWKAIDRVTREIKDKGQSFVENELARRIEQLERHR
jgi:hypothetical protein